MGLSNLFYLTANLVGMSWSTLTYIPWYYITGQRHRAIMHARKKSVVKQDGNTRGAADHDDLVETFSNCKTVVEALRKITLQCREFQCMGVRELISETDETQPNGRVFKKSTYGDYKWNTFADLADDVESLAAGLDDLGMKKGDKIAIYMETRKEWLTLAHAAWRAGYCVVTVYASLGEQAVIDAIEESEATVLFASAPLLEKNGAKVSTSCNLTHIIYAEHENLQKACLDRIKESVQLVAYNDLVRFDSVNYDAPNINCDDLAIIMYTSGTTGKAKGVMILHRNLTAAVAGLAARIGLSGMEFDENDSYIGYLPLAHILELAAENMILLKGCKIGYSSPLTLSDKSAKIKAGTMGDARALRPTIMTSVPEILERIRKAVNMQIKESSAVKRTVFNFAFNYKKTQIESGGDAPLLNWLIFGKTRELLGGRLKVMVAGGAPTDPKTQEFMSICMSCPLVIGYGLTETCACGCVQDAYDRSSGRVGGPLVSALIKLEDWAEGNYFIKNNPPQGEICIGGPVVTAGYFKMPEKTAEDYFVENGIRYFRTGDIGEWEEDGALRIIDRKKDLCKMRHGEYIALGKIEAVLKTSQAINNICIYGAGSILYPVAICLPVVKTVQEWAQEENLMGSFSELCEMKPIIDRMNKAILQAAKEGNLLKTEIPTSVFLDGRFEAGWLPETGLITDAFKLKRKQLNEFYENEITKMTQ